MLKVVAVLLLCTSLCLSFPQDKFPVRRTRELEDGADKVINALQNGQKLSKEVIGEVKENFEELYNTLKEAEADIAAIYKDIGELNTQHLTITKSVIDKYNEARGRLRVTRQGLRTLAHKTISAVGRMKIIMEDWEDQYDKELTQGIFFEMKDLMADSAKILEKAKEEYNGVLTAFEELGTRMEIFKSEVGTLVDKHGQNYAKWTEAIRGAAYGTAGTVTVGLIIADVFGCLGLCSTIGGGVSFATAAVSAESTIADLETAFNQIKKKSEKAVEGLNGLSGKLNKAAEFITLELNIVIEWESEAADVSRNIEKWPPALLRKIKAFRRSFVHDLDDLLDVAQRYLDQPENLFPDSESQFPSKKVAQPENLSPDSES